MCAVKMIFRAECSAIRSEKSLENIIEPKEATIGSPDAFFEECVVLGDNGSRLIQHRHNRMDKYMALFVCSAMSVAMVMVVMWASGAM